MRDELSRELRDLVDRARRDEVPADVDLKRRVRRAVSLGIPASAALASNLAAASGATAAGSVGVAAVAKTSAGLLHGFLAWVAGGFALGMSAMIGSVVWYASEPGSQPAALASAVGSTRRSAAGVRGAHLEPAQAPSATAALPQSVEIAVPAPKMASLAPANGSAAPAAPMSNESRPAASLADEIALLARVQRELRDGQGQAALETIEEASQRFPRGQLGPDFQAARVLAWCELGDTVRARRVADVFLRMQVTSLLAERVRRSCAFVDEGTDLSREENGSPR